MLDAVRTLLPKWRVAGVEISSSARAVLLARGYSALPGIEALGAAAKFDWINMDNVLEHMPDPRAVLTRLKTHLSPGGFIYIDVPNESFFPFRYRINDLARGFRKPPLSRDTSTCLPRAL
jgi:SAM-dependent methyltransferase